MEQGEGGTQALRVKKRETRESDGKQEKRKEKLLLSSRGEGPNRESAPKCFTCGQAGHYAQGCTSKAKKQQEN